MTSRPGQRFQTQNVELQARLQGVELASFRSRALAFVVDSLLISAVLVALTFWVGTVAIRLDPSVVLNVETRGFLSVAIAVLYFSLATYLGKGATVGKRLFGIRVVSLVHDHLSLWHCFERCLGYAASSIEAGFGFLQYFNHANHQTVHDRIAETIVIVDRARTSP